MGLRSFLLIAVALAAASVTAAAAEPAYAQTHARLRPSVRAGTAAGSDLFLGAGLGPAAEAHLAPSVRGDLSLSPRLKFASEYAAAVGFYGPAGSRSLQHRLDLGGRFRLAPPLLARLDVFGEQQRLSAARSLTDTVGLRASRSAGAGAAPAIEWTLGTLRLEASGAFSAESYQLDDGGYVDGAAQRGTLAASRALGPVRARVAASVVHEGTSAPQFTYDGASGHLALLWAAWDSLAIRAEGALYRNVFATPRRDTLLRLGTGVVWAFADSVALETSYGYAINASSDGAYDASRHYAYLGLLWEAEVLRW